MDGFERFDRDVWRKGNPQDAGIVLSNPEFHVACQYVNIREIEDMIELYKVSHWFARSKHNIP